MICNILYLGAGCLQPLWRAELWRCIIAPNQRSVSYLLSTTTMNNELIEKLQKLLAEGKGDEVALLREALIEKSQAKASGDKSYLDHAEDYIDFTYTNPTVWHATDFFSKKLEKAGFKYLPEKELWSQVGPGLYYTTRSGSSLVAFVVGPDWTPEKGVGAIGSHIDALATVVKPNSTKSDVDGYNLLGVANYAGALSSVWWDRDLGVGGRLLVKEKGRVKHKLVDSTPHPVARIPTLAPHFGAAAAGPFDKETQTVPIVGFGGEVEPTKAEKLAPLYGKHPLKLLRYISKISGHAVEDIVQWDLQLYDVQKGVVGGLDNEFVFAPRVDDRVCSYSAITGLIEATDKLPKDGFSVVGLFDNEEVGSGTRQGARGHLFLSTVERVASSSYYNPGEAELTDLIKVAFANSIILSADVTHLFNPNFPNAYLENHKPVPNKGISIALDPNGNMATDSTGLALVEELAKKNGDELQYFHIRNGSPSGGTIGPYLSIQTGARTIDLGIPQLSMHSIRATLGSKDVGLAIKFFSGFFKNWRCTYDNYDQN